MKIGGNHEDRRESLQEIREEGSPNPYRTWNIRYGAMSGNACQREHKECQREGEC